MKLKWFLCFIIMLLFVSDSHAANAGYLWISSKPKNALIYLDGEYTNMMTPANKLIEAEAGRHKLELSKQGHKLYEEWLDFEEAKVLEVEVLMASSDSDEKSKTISTRYVEVYLTVRSDPPGSDVYLDDKNIGKTPVASYAILPGQDTDIKLLIEKKGYHPYESFIYASDMKSRIKINVSEKLKSIAPIPELPSLDGREEKKGGFVINKQVLLFAGIFVVMVIVIIVRFLIMRKRGQEDK